MPAQAQHNPFQTMTWLPPSSKAPDPGTVRRAWVENLNFGFLGGSQLSKCHRRASLEAGSHPVTDLPFSHFPSRRYKERPAAPKSDFLVLFFPP